MANIDSPHKRPFEKHLNQINPHSWLISSNSSNKQMVSLCADLYYLSQNLYPNI